MSSRLSVRALLTLSAAAGVGLWLTGLGALSSYRLLGLVGAAMGGVATGLVERRHDPRAPAVWRHVAAWVLWGTGAFAAGFLLQPVWPRLEEAWSLVPFASFCSALGGALALTVDARRSRLAARIFALALGTAVFRAENLSGAFVVAGLAYALVALRPERPAGR